MSPVKAKSHFLSFVFSGYQRNHQTTDRFWPDTVGNRQAGRKKSKIGRTNREIQENKMERGEDKEPRRDQTWKRNG